MRKRYLIYITISIIFSIICVHCDRKRKEEEEEEVSLLQGFEEGGDYCNRVLCNYGKRCLLPTSFHQFRERERERDRLIRVPVVVLEGAGDDPARGFGCGLPWPAAALGRPISHHESPVLRDRHQRRPPRRRPPAALPLPVLRGRPFPRLRRRRRRLLPQGSPAAGEFQEPHPPPFQINTSPLTLSPYIYYGRDSSSLLGMTKRPFLSRILFSPYLRLRSTVLAESLFPTLRSRSYIGSSP